MRPPTMHRMVLVSLFGLAGMLRPAASAAAPGDKLGRMLTIAGTIDTGLKNKVVRTARQAAQQGVETLIFDIQVTGGEFAPCYDLANEITRLGENVRRTIAFVSKDLAGHAVLIALACDEIVMAETVRLGDLARDPVVKNPTPTMEVAYREIAQKKGHNIWLSQALLQRDTRFWEATLPAPAGKRFVTEEELDKLTVERQVVDKKIIKDAGQPLVLDAAAAKRFGLVKRTANSRKEVAFAYDLPESTAMQDTLRDEALKPVLLRLVGAIDGHMHQFVLRRLQQAKSAGSNLLFVEVESNTGDETSAMLIGRALRQFPGKKVAWVPQAATSAATILILACDEIVVAPAARLGGLTLKAGDEGERQALVDAIVSEIAKDGQFPAAVVRGLIDQQAAVHKVQNARNPAVAGYLTAAQLADPETKKVWQNARLIKEKNIVWSLEGEKARAFDFAVALAENQDQLKSQYDLAGALPTLQPTWVDYLVELLTTPAATVFLIVVGVTCIYIELQIPGFGVAGILGAICLTLFFWAQFLSGTANALEIILFLLGLLLLGIELFVLPGFGVTGVAGILLMFASLVLASQSFSLPSNEVEIREFMTNILTVSSSFIVLIMALLALGRMFPRMGLFRRFMLDQPGAEEASHDADEPPSGGSLADLVGRKGTTLCQLHPTGRVRIGDRSYDVVAQGEFIDDGSTIEVIDANALRIVVRQADKSA